MVSQLFDTNVILLVGGYKGRYKTTSFELKINVTFEKKINMKLKIISAGEIFLNNLVVLCGGQSSYVN